MSYVRALKALVALLDQNLRLLEAHQHLDPSPGVGAIAVRRRRACSSLRASLRLRGETVPHLAARGQGLAPAATMNDLRRAESKLLGSYDAVLGLIDTGAAESRLLHDQRAESEQAYLSFATRPPLAMPLPRL